MFFFLIRISITEFLKKSARQLSVRKLHSDISNVCAAISSIQKIHYILKSNLNVSYSKTQAKQAFKNWKKKIYKE